MSSSDATAGTGGGRFSLTETFLPRFMKLAAVQPGERVVDIASAGPEAAVEAITRTGTEGEVLVVRSEQEPLDEVAARCRAWGLPVPRLERMEAEHLRLPDSYWDLALCHLGLAELHDPERALSEMTRVLRPVGRVAVSVLSERDRCPLLTIFVDVVGRYLPAVTSAVWALFRYGEPGKLANLLASAGFEDAVPERTTEWVSFRDVDHYWQAIVDILRVGASARQLPAEVAAACKAELARRTRFYRRGDHIELKIEAVILAAVK